MGSGFSIARLDCLMVFRPLLIIVFSGSFPVVSLIVSLIRYFLNVIVNFLYKN